MSHNSPVAQLAMGNRVTIIAISRESPGTRKMLSDSPEPGNDGSFQRLVIELSCSRALFIGMQPEDFDLANSIQHFDAAGCENIHS